MCELHLTVGIMSRTAVFKTLCVKGGTHPFSPQTREVQFDEKWAFVGKKQQHCDPGDPADSEQGDNWDHVAFEPTHRLVVSVVPGKRTAVKTDALVKAVHMRTGGCLLDLLVSDEYRLQAGDAAYL